jgi:hypothetical protein
MQALQSVLGLGQAASSGTTPGWASGIGTMGQLGTGILGVIGNLIQGQRMGGVQNQMINYQKFMANLAQNPAAMQAYIQGFQQPLSQNLINQVGNATQGRLMESGLGLSPQISQAVLGQALAPYVESSQQLAAQTALSTLGLPYNKPIGAFALPKIDTSGFWRMFLPNAPKSSPVGANPNASSGGLGSGPTAPSGMDYTWPGAGGIVGTPGSYNYGMPASVGTDWAQTPNYSTDFSSGYWNPPTYSSTNPFNFGQ